MVNILLNNECLRHLMNRIPNKDHKTATYEINKISLIRFDDKKCIQNNGNAVNYIKNNYLNNYSENPFFQTIKILF